MFGQIRMFVEFTGKKTGWDDDDKAVVAEAACRIQGTTKYEKNNMP